MTDPETREIFEKAKTEKIPRYNKPIIDCLVCNGTGVVVDAKSFKVRGCVGCNQTGKIKNTNRRYKRA